jgi:AAA family ATP:ADP antiporter
MLGRLGRGISAVLKQLFVIDKQERVKFALLTLTFFLVIASYTLVRELKDSIFMTVVGEQYLAWIKIASIVVMVPAVMLYAYLVDRMRRYQLLAFYSLAYGALGVLMAYFIGHPTIGIANTVASPYRLFGWVFYFFIEGYSPFLVGAFWAFANSVTSPEEAKKNYGIMVAGSKFGGLLSAIFAWYLFSCQIPSVMSLSGVFKHQALMGVSALLLLFVPLALQMLIKYVPGHLLHGYETAYQLEKHKSKEEKGKVGMLSGLRMFWQYPYVLGVFGIIFFYEVSFVVLNYQRLLLVKSSSVDISQMSCTLFEQVFMVHLVGCLFSLVGTSFLMRRLGERKSLMLIPILSGLLILYFVLVNTLQAIIVVFVGLRALNYAFSYPVRESLYIPTVKEVKFKSKSWIDAFGTRIAKAFGYSFNICAQNVLTKFGLAAFAFANSIFLGAIVLMWGVTAYLLGKRFQRAVENNEVIGASSEAE